MLTTTPFGPVTRFDLARTLLGHGRYWTSAYLVDGLLIDTGCAHSARELQGALAGTHLQAIANTHTHEDHIGANGLLEGERSDLVAWAHPLALRVLEDPSGCQPLNPYRRLFWGWPQASQGQPLADGDCLETEHYRFQVIYTPGHSPDHLCLYEARQGWLFSGDLFVGGQDRALRAGSDIWQIIAGLKRIADLPMRVLFPGSAQVRSDPQQALKAKISYLEALGERIMKAYRQGHSTGRIARSVCGPPMWIEWVTLGHFSRRQLVNSYLQAVFSSSHF